MTYIILFFFYRAFNLNGLLVQHLNSVHFGEYRGGNNSEIRFHQLPVEGTFVNVGFEKLSGHMLVSTRPSQRDGVNHGSHLLCDLSQYYSETLERNVVTSNVVRVYEVIRIIIWIFFFSNHILLLIECIIIKSNRVVHIRQFVDHLSTALKKDMFMYWPMEHKIQSSIGIFLYLKQIRKVLAMLQNMY